MTARDVQGLDPFRFGDAPIRKALHAHRVQIVGQGA
ncbi:hypothetical protein SAMN05444680_113142 [Variovorax sp. YR216]|nr:hypothetical protein SAMN05444680_113142 [Variovorax sp. YR216]